MLTALVATTGAVALGLVLTLVGSARSAWLLPLRSFAMAALLSVVVLVLMPEALATAGAKTLAVFALGIVLPSIASWGLSRVGGGKHRGEHHREHHRDHDRHRDAPHRDHRVVTMIAGVGGVLLHQFGDGVALGAFSTGAHADHQHWEVVVGVAAHTVPVVAVLLMAVEQIKRRLAMALAMVVAVALGMAFAKFGDASTSAAALPWLNALVAGLLLHILAHDIPTINRSFAIRGAETLLVVAGLLLPWLASELHSHDAAEIAHTDVVLTQLWAVITLCAPAVLAGLVATTLVVRRPVGWTSTLQVGGLVGAGAGVAAAMRLPLCSCRALPAGQSLANRGAAATAVLSFVVVAPEISIDTLALTWQLLGWQAVLLRLAGVALVVVAVAAMLRRVGGKPAANGASSAALTPKATSPGSSPGPSATPFLDTVDEAMIHSGPWLLAGLVAAAFAALALQGQAWPSGPGATVLTLAVAGLAYVCAQAATPLAAVLVAHGMAPTVAIVALLLGAMLQRATLGFVSKQFGVVSAMRFAVATLAVLALLALPLLLTGVAVGAEAAEVHVPPRWLSLLAVALLAAWLLRSLWRFGLSAWLEPIIGASHAHHHQHDPNEPCTDGCHAHHGHDAHMHAHETAEEAPHHHRHRPGHAGPGHAGHDADHSH